MSHNEKDFQEYDDAQKPLVKNPLLNFWLTQNLGTIKRAPLLCALALLLFTIGITIEGSWGEVFDLLKTWIVIGVVLAIWIGIMLGLSKVVGAKAAGIIGGLLFLAVPIGFLFYIVACWGGGC